MHALCLSVWQGVKPGASFQVQVPAAVSPPVVPVVQAGLAAYTDANPMEVAPMISPAQGGAAFGVGAPMVGAGSVIEQLAGLEIRQARQPASQPASQLASFLSSAMHMHMHACARVMGRRASGKLLACPREPVAVGRLCAGAECDGDVDGVRDEEQVPSPRHNDHAQSSGLTEIYGWRYRC
jgi:hypothetical protein